MRVRSEWLTLFTLTGLAAGGYLMPKADGGIVLAAAKRVEVGAAGVDYTPTGSARAVEKVRAQRLKLQGPRP